MIPVIWTGHFKPSDWQQYSRALFKKNQLCGHSAPSLPNIRLIQRGVKINSAHFKHYRQCLSLNDSLIIPPLYWQTVSLPMQLYLFNHSSFPFKALGMVHITNRVTQWQPLPVEAKVDLNCHIEGVRSHKKGWQFDVVVDVVHDNRVGLRATATYLYRTHSVRKTGESTPQQIRSEDSRCHNIFVASKNIGRQYARVSGDKNPIHLNGMLARMFGFKSAIAHGMWTKGRCLGLLESRLEERFEVRTDFKRPVYLPSQVSLMIANSAPGTEFTLQSDAGIPHLTGTIIPPEPQPESKWSAWAD